MARTVLCKLGDKTIDIKEALSLPDGGKGGAFRCVGCGHPVVAHRGGSDGEAHFEHAPGRNNQCRGHG